MSRRTVVTVSVAAICAISAVIYGLRDEPHRARKLTALEPLAVPAAPIEAAPAIERVPVEPAEAASSASNASSASSAQPLDEAALMDKLRELRGSDPALTLQLAREGNARFKSSVDAAERTWFVVKSLTDLGRHDEARAEGKGLVHDYPGTTWAEDVYRHLFVNPPTHPFERGYGRQHELD